MKIGVVGAGLVGLSTAMLLADDGHEVTVLERDVESPTDPAVAFEAWERRGVNQFRLPHLLQARLRALLEAELPRVVDGLVAAGALRLNLFKQIPDTITGPKLPEDDRFATITGRRPVVEAVFATAAADTPGVTVRRGAAAAGLHTTGTGTSPPHAGGVVLDSHEVFDADLVVDAGGRRSPLVRWLSAIAARPPEEELEESGFAYYGRHFRSADGEFPAMLGPPVQEYGSVSVGLFPADNGTWSVTVFTAADDVAARRLRDLRTWTAVVGSFPLAAHWIDAEPIEDGVNTISKIEDRRRRLVVDGAPVVTGVLPVGDAWACTNPSLGRGASLGLLHAVALRDLLRTGPVDSPRDLVLRWDEVTETQLRPWYDATLFVDRHRLAAVKAIIAGHPYEPDDPRWELQQCLQAASTRDPDCLRAVVAIANVLQLPDEALDGGVGERALALGRDWRDAPRLGPDRQELLALLG